MEVDRTDERDVGDSRPLSFLFFLLHPGYIRYFSPVLCLLAERGHRVHLAFSWPEKDPGDGKLLQQLLESQPAITAGPAPHRERRDGWRAVALLTRSMTDLARYSHPRYRDAPALRARIRRRFSAVVDEAPGLNEAARRICRLLVRFASSPASAARADGMVGALAAVERALPSARAVDAYLAARRPDAVIASPVIDFASTQVEALKSARSLGIPSGVAVASWDNLTGKGLLRVVPDRVFVWNAAQRREAAEMHRIPAERVVVTGAPKFDEWFARRPSPQSDFTERIGLPQGDYLLYVCSSSFIAPNEVDFVREWLGGVRAGDDVLASIGVLVRPHPQNARQWRGVSFAGLGPVVVWPSGGAQPDAGAARADFFDSLVHSRAVVGVNTSAMIEAAIVGKPVLSVLSGQFSGTQEGTLHFRYLLHENDGFVHVAHGLDEHVEQLREAIAGGSERADGFIERFVRPLGRDVAAAPVLASACEQLARSKPLDPRRESAATYALRGLLTPLAFAARAMARRGAERATSASLRE
jgi:hypothetical protein